jgi:hypothetical protein
MDYFKVLGPYLPEKPISNDIQGKNKKLAAEQVHA